MFFRLIWKAVKFSFYVMFLGVPAIIIILFCYAYLNDIQYTNGFWQYVDTLLSSNQNPMEIVWGVILNFPFSDLLNNLGQDVLGDVIDFGQVVSNAGQIVKDGSIGSELFIGLVQLSLAQFVMFLVTRFNTVLQKIWRDKTFKFAYWYVSIFWTIVSFTVSATILKFMCLIIEPQYLKTAFLIVMFAAYFLHAVLLAKGGSLSTLLFCIVYLGLDMIFFFIQSVLIWYLGTSMFHMLSGDFGTRFIPCFIVYFVFLMLKDFITKVLLSAMHITPKITT